MIYYLRGFKSGSDFFCSRAALQGGFRRYLSAPHRPKKVFGVLIAILHLDRVAGRCSLACKSNVAFITSLGVSSGAIRSRLLGCTAKSFDWLVFRVASIVSLTSLIRRW